jgi:hypothetical protein
MCNRAHFTGELTPFEDFGATWTAERPKAW